MGDSMKIRISRSDGGKRTVTVDCMVSDEEYEVEIDDNEEVQIQALAVAEPHEAVRTAGGEYDVGVNATFGQVRANTYKRETIYEEDECSE